MNNPGRQTTGSDSSWSGEKQANRALWDAWTPAHVNSRFYDVEGFKQGRCSLCPIEIDEVGGVTGKSLLHLQCHFGMDTLSWARRGAEVTGIDFSPKAIETAQSLADELKIPARFLCSDIYDLPEHLSAKYDVIFTSQGVLAWLPDLELWGRIIAHFLKPGGFFYIFEFHPLMNIFACSEEAPRIKHRYFHQYEPEVYGPYCGSYATAEGIHEGKGYEWIHSLSDVINALTGAGLRIEFIHEFPFCTHQSHKFLSQGEDGLWRYGEQPESLPLMFSVKAVCEAPAC